MEVNMYFFIADEHYGHKNIIKYQDRPFKDVVEMDETMISNHNSVVTVSDITVHAGDFCWVKDYISAHNYIRKLNGNHIFLKGSHDRWMHKNSSMQIWEKMIEKNYLVVCHYAMHSWPRSHYNSWHLYGHCLDMNTEVLTKSGWKFRSELSINDIILTFNVDTDSLEYNRIDEIIDYPNYCGDIYCLESKGIDIRVTENHVMLDISRGNGSIRKFYAKDINRLERRMFIKAGSVKSDGVNLSDDYIRLLVWIAADSSVTKYNLARTRVLKHRKSDRIKQLLNKLNIKYTDNTQKDDSTCYNFRIPDTLLKYKLKPLSNVVLSFNRSQVQQMLLEYVHTDGCRNGNSIIIYTSKKEEADLIQIASITNGYTCNISRRVGRGFSKKPSYELVITDKSYRIHSGLNEKVVIDQVLGESVWCVRVKNKTMMIRRNGKPLIVGNSHHDMGLSGKRHCISVENTNYYPLSFDQIKEIMENKPDNPNFIKPEDRNR